jgi:hypothetical protein
LVHIVVGPFGTGESKQIALGAGLHRWRRGLKALEEAAEVST